MMSRSSAPRPMLLLTFGLASIALTIGACSPAAPKDDAVQSSAQSSAEDTAQITIDGVPQSTIDELIKLYPEIEQVPQDEVIAELSEQATEAGMTIEDYLQAVIRETRENDEAMRRAVEEATGNAPAQSH
ncbi:hypothetical protein [Schaalia hyovaginalis]|uniref:hypothetical protein n=1 Tax=Schaalia hyovaginalis TaxID=29316 RepID=UPI001F454A71|nr:hypothetical protein [Schaalia hyovaginalis]MCF2710514.1 hypothetical protein [Schaalia hyovaginalis]